MDDLRRFDLNLLVAFEALMSERSVTGAARRLGLGQPAMSNALARLRELFDDELLTRAHTGMQPTSRALALVDHISRILAELREQVFPGSGFRPQTDSRMFRIGVSDQVEVALMHDVLHRLRSEAPNVQLVARSVELRLGSDLLSNGAVDLAIGYYPQADSELHVSTLYHESFVCLFDAAACGVTPPLSLETYASLPHILVSLTGEPYGHFDAALQGQGLTRRIVYTTPHFLAVPFLLRGFRAVAAVPRRLAEHCAEAADLTTCPVPLPPDGYAISMAWHRRSANDPAQRWLRTVFADVGRGRGKASVSIE